MTTEKRNFSNCADQNQCGNCLKVVGVVGVIGNLLLTVMKLVIGIAFLSTALIADALYSILDVGYSVLIIVGLKISSKPPDSSHDYGHGKVEFIITIAFAVLTVIGAIVLFLFALFELHEGAMGTFSGYVLLAAIISTVANYLFYRYADCIASQFDSPSIRSLSIHSQADAISSVLVTVSMAFAYWGYHHAGPIVAIIETAHILIISAEIFKGSLYGLLDASISPKDIKKINIALSSIPGIRNINHVKSRKIGQKIWLNIEIETPSSFSISRVETIKDSINSLIKEKIGNIEDIMVSVMPFREEDSEVSVVSRQ